MRRILLALPVGLALGTSLLSGCAGYDRFAEPASSLTLDRAMDRCVHSRPADVSKEHSEFTSCQLAAQRDFAVAIHVKRMDVFDTYARAMRQVAADWDAKKFSPDEAHAQGNEIWHEYLAKCDCTLGQTNPRNDMAGPPPLAYVAPN